VPEAELERLVKLRICVVRHSDPGYPRLLREITLPPPLIYVRGALAPEDDWAVAIVGTRRATAYGRQVTERLARELAEQRITIVSGLAGANALWQIAHRYSTGQRISPLVTLLVLSSACASLLIQVYLYTIFRSGSPGSAVALFLGSGFWGTGVGMVIAALGAIIQISA
jgi:DNA recombination-mediator protein A